MKMQSLTFLATEKILEGLSCEELRQLPENKRCVLRQNIYVETQYHLCNGIDRAFQLGPCGLFGECYCFKCSMGEVMPLTDLAALVVKKTLTSKILKRIPQELHILFREDMCMAEQVKMFGDYKEYDWPTGSLTHHALFSSDGEYVRITWDFGPNGNVTRVQHYQKGHKSGWTLYDDNQQITETRCYTIDAAAAADNNREVAKTVYYKNGQKCSVSTTKNFQYHGPYYEYHDNGEVARKLHFWKNQRHGKYTTHRRRSYMAGFGFYKNDVPVRVWNLWDIFKIYWSMTSCCYWGDQSQDRDF